MKGRYLLRISQSCIISARILLVQNWSKSEGTACVAFAALKEGSGGWGVGGGTHLIEMVLRESLCSGQLEKQRKGDYCVC